MAKECVFASVKRFTYIIILNSDCVFKHLAITHRHKLLFNSALMLKMLRWYNYMFRLVGTFK